MEKVKIIRNRIRCKVCGEVIESKSVHDFVVCHCWRESGGKAGVFVDGGKSYLRRGGINWEEMSETRPYTEEEIAEEERRRDEQYKLLYGKDYKEWS